MLEGVTTAKQRRRNCKYLVASCLQHKYHYFLLIFVIISLSTTRIQAQEYPNDGITTNQFNTSRTFRTNVCQRSEEFRLGRLDMSNALSGIDLSVIMRKNEYFNQNGDGSINEDYPGLTGVLMDELSRRANFTWRNTFTTLERPKEGSGKTFTDLLYWTTLTYDISVNWWTWSTERREMGIDFPIPWYDSSIIMVGERNNEDEYLFDITSMFDPFHYSVWIMIAVTIFVSGCVYFAMETLDPTTDLAQLQFNPLHCIFLACYASTGHFEFKPRSTPSRLFSFSLTFCFLIIGAAYTANMASVLVVQNTPEVEVNSLRQAVALGMEICTYKDTAEEQIVMKAFPQANIIRKTTEAEVFLGVHGKDVEYNSASPFTHHNKHDKLCKLALSTYHSWQYWSRNETTNPECSLEWVGQKFNEKKAGFATLHDSSQYCTSFIYTVLNYHLDEMDRDNFIELTWENHVERSATPDLNCQAEDALVQDNNDNDTTKLNLKNMGGIFILHFSICIITLVMVLIKKYCHKKKSSGNKQDVENRLSRRDTFDVDKLVKHGDLLDVFHNQPEGQQIEFLQRSYKSSYKSQNNVAGSSTSGTSLEHILEDLSVSSFFENMLQDLSTRQAKMELQMSTIIILLQQQQQKIEKFNKNKVETE